MKTFKNSYIIYLFILISFSPIARCDFEDIKPAINSVSVDPNTFGDSWRFSSYMGGNQLYLKGTDFSTQSPMMNKVDFDKANAECPVVEFLTTSSQVVCTIPPVIGLVDRSVPVNMVVNDKFRASCSQCNIYYSYGATPLLKAVIPGAGSPGQNTTFYGTQRVSSIADVDFLNIGDFRCDFNFPGYEYNPLTFSNINTDVQIPCKIPDQEPGLYSVSQKNSYNTGYAWKFNNVRNYHFGLQKTYDFAIIPAIKSLSSNTGSSKGQIITITGTGFSTTNNEVKLGDTACNIISQTSTTIVCELQETSGTISARGYHAGLKQEVYNFTTNINTVRTTNPTPSSTGYVLDAQNLLYSTNYVMKLSGYFRAPTTGNYKFYLSVDDNAELWLSNDTSKTNLARIAIATLSSNYKYYWGTNNKPISDEVSLTAGEYYYMESYQNQGGGPDYLTVGVQIPNVENKPAVNVLPTIQKITIGGPIDYEIVKYTISGTGGVWSLTVTSSDGLTKTSSNNITNGATEAQVVSGLSNIAKVNVTKTVIDETTNEYVVTFLTRTGTKFAPQPNCKYLTGATCANAERIQTPSTPISGTWTITKGLLSVDVNYDASIDTVIETLRKLGYTPPMRGHRTGDPRDSVTWQIVFVGETGPVEQLNVDKTDLLGSANVDEITITATITQESDNSTAFYEVIPFEHLFTAHENPQITVKSNGVQGYCPSNDNDCDFTIVTADLPTITDATFSSPTLTITITNSDSYTSAQTRVFFGNVECTSVSLSSGSITATCDVPEFGIFKPRVHFDGFGYADVDAGVSDITVAGTITSITTPSGTTVNPNGGSTLTIDGTGYPISLAQAKLRSLAVTVGGAACSLLSVSSTQIVCMAGAQNNNANVEILLNSASISDTTSLTLMTTYPTISSISPTSLNPVIQVDITITGTDFDATNAATTVTLVNSTTNRVINCEVKEPCDETTITCLFLGGKSGSYELYVTTSNGNSNSIPITLGVNMDSVSPSTGSVAGGTLITISGETFSPLVSQTLVYIGPAVGYILCDVVSSTETEVECRTRPMTSDVTAEVPQDVLVATRIVEEATCSGTCQFTYSYASTPNITAITAGPYYPGQTITVTGSNLDSSTMTIGGYAAVTSDFTVEGFTATVSSTMPTGTGLQIVVNNNYGNADFLVSSTVDVKPVISSISPTTVNTANGILLTISGFGFNANTVAKVGSTTCPIRTLSSTEIICWTKTTGAVTVSDSFFTGETCGSCTLTSASTTGLAISAFSATDGTLSITGTGFTTSSEAWLSNPSLPGVAYALEGTFTTTSFSAPISSIPAGTYTVEVVESGRLASYSVSPKTITISLSASATNSDSSVAGGMSLTITGSGFDETISKNNKVTVCGFNCPVISATSTELVCTVPPFINPAVLSTYPNIITDSFLSGTWWGDSAGVLTDSLESSYLSVSGSSCQFGLYMGSGLAAIVSEIKWFPRVNSDAAKFAGTVIEGSTDNSTFTTIVTIDKNNHDGWNFWNGTTSSYSYFRVSGNSTTGSCAFAEIRFTGKTVSTITTDPSASSGVACDAVVTVSTISAISQTISSAVTYKNSVTPVLYSFTPTMGTAIGGTTVQITGANFVVDDAKVYIDNNECVISGSTTSSSIECVTAAAPDISLRTNSLYSTFVIRFSTVGDAITNGTTFLYIDRWSAKTTWGGISPPREGDSVLIPNGQSVLLDVSTPILKAIVIEGALIFEDERDVTLDASYIFISGGRLQIGTWEKPFQHKATITMHGTKADPMLPHYGNKVIALRTGIIDFHGKPLSKTWTKLDSTVEAGASSIVVIEDVSDWNIGDQIVITSTDHDHYQSENRKITDISVTDGKTTITLDSPLKYLHYAGVQTFGSGVFDMRAQVGLLTRNVKIQGDELSEANLYGVHIMTFSPGDDSSIGRISYTEVTQAGQAFNLGRYPIHFHLIGNVHQSYVIGNAIHHTYNRAVTIHGVHYLRVQKNVAYWVMGHTIFIEDGIETHNLIEENLVINTRSSAALLNTDQTPACFWITNPNNIWRNNVCAGSDRYGFWFDLRAHPEGPSATDSICPVGEKLGEFNNNEAHSCGRYGLRIFHEHIPRTYPCQSASDYSLADPFSANPPIQSNFQNFLGWKNMRDTVIGERLGAVKFTNILSADNLRAGIEISDGNYGPPGSMMVDGAVLVGQSENAGDPALYDATKVRGLITPKVEWFFAQNIEFYNYNSQMTVIETCSHCEHNAATGPGAMTSYFSGLTIVNCTQKVRFNIPYRDILVDVDGTLTGTAGGSVTYDYLHLQGPGCEHDELFDGLVCDDTVSLRKLQIRDSFTPADLELMDLRVLKVNPPFDDSKYSNVSISNYSTVIYKAKPFRQWTMVVRTGDKYKFHWANGIDWTYLTLTKGASWIPSDPTTTILFNHSEYREAFRLRRSDPNGSVIITPNQTYLWTSSNSSSLSYADWFHDNNTQLLYTILDGKKNGTLTIQGYRCLDNCPKPTDPTQVPKDPERRWSNASIWPNSTIPKDGDTVIIPASWSLILDTNTSNLKLLHIQGDLIFDNNTISPITLQSNLIWVEGNLIIGTADYPFQQQAKILITGNREAPSLILGEYLDVSNKALAVTGNFTAYGQPVSVIQTRLTVEAAVGSTNLTLADNVDGIWKIGDQVIVCPTNRAANETEMRTITGVYQNTITINTGLLAYHFGAATVTDQSSYGTLDMRAEVGHISRNIIIEGTRDDLWGGRLYVTQMANAEEGKIARGHVYLDSIALVFAGHANTSLAGLTFESRTASGAISVFRNSVVRESEGWNVLIRDSSDILMENNIFYYSKTVSVSFEGDIENLIFKNNLIADNRDRSLIIQTMALDYNNGIRAYQAKFLNSQISDNIICGCVMECVAIVSGDCTKSTNTYTFFNNVAHSGWEGLLAAESGSKCIGINRFVGYKLGTGIASAFKASEIIAQNIILSDVEIGFAVNTGSNDGVENKITLKDSILIGVALKDYPNAYVGRSAECSNGVAMQTSISTTGAKSIPPSPVSLPWRKPKSNYVFNGINIISNVHFKNFDDALVSNCVNNRLIASNEYASDGANVALFRNINKTNVNVNNLFNIYSASLGSIGLDNCGGWVCTGWRNVLFKDMDGTLTGTPSSTIGNNAGIGANNDNCQFISHGDDNIYYNCQGTNWARLKFDSQDVDKDTRIITPINVTKPESGYWNSLNQYEDHGWDGFYTSLKRLARFDSIVPTNTNYTILYTGTLPGTLRFQIQGADSSNWVIVKQRYTRPQIVQISFANGTVVKNIIPKNGVGINESSTCGANIATGVEQTIEFKLTGEADCILFATLTTGVIGRVRFNIDIDDFYTKNGPQSLIDKIANALGLDLSRIRIVSITRGSAIVDFQVLPSPNATNATSESTDIAASLNTLITDPSFSVADAAVLDYSVQVAVVETPSSTNNTNNNNNNNNNNGTNNGGGTTILASSEKSKSLIIIAIIIGAAALGIGGALMFIKLMQFKKSGKVSKYSDKVAKKYFDEENLGLHAKSAVEDR